MTKAVQIIDDTEYRLCKSCQDKGYGPDSWHPATSEFWMEVEGKVYFSKCKCCYSESRHKKVGIVPVTKEDLRYAKAAKV